MSATTRAAKRAATAGALGLLLVAGSTAGAAQAAPSAPVRCGDTLTVSTRLSADLTCPQGDGLVLGPGVTLDLGGHTLRGPGGGVGAAVDLSPTGYSALVGGTVRDWGSGAGNVTAEPAQALVDGVRFVSAPVQSWGGHLTISGSRLVDSPVGQLQGSLTIVGTVLVRSPVEVQEAPLVIERSTVTGAGLVGGAGSAVQVRSSTLDGAGYGGAVATCDGSPVSITASSVSRYAAPVRGEGCDVVLSGSTFSDNPAGVLDGAGTEGGTGSATVTRSTFRRSGVALRGSGMVVRDSTFRDGVSGVVALRPQTVTVTGSRFVRNSGSGLLAEGVGLTVGGNSATRNGQYGLYAPGAVDQGGNVARRNAAGDCVGVACRGQR